MTSREMKVQTIYRSCNEKLTSLGLKPKFRIAKIVIKDIHNALGQCAIYHSGHDSHFAIFVNPAIVDDEKSLTETICHELLHTVDGCFDHGKLFKLYSRRIFTKYGISIETKCDAVESGLVAKYEFEKGKGKYLIYCKNCDFAQSYQRAGKVVQHYKDCTCPCCGSDELGIKTK